MNDSVQAGLTPQRRPGAVARDAWNWRDALVALALAVGLAALVRGLVKGRLLDLHGHLVDGLWTNIGLLAAVVLLVGATSVVARRYARSVFFVAFAAALLIAFGWAGVLWATIAFLAFASLGQAIMPAGAPASVFSLSLQATIGAACYVLLLGVMVHFRINTPLTYGLLLLLPLLNRPAFAEVTVACRALLSPRKKPSIREIAVATLLLFILAMHLTGAGLPERYADGVLYHLFFGQAVARLTYWPADFHSLVWAVMPAGTDWLLGIGTMMNGEVGAKALSFLVFLLLLANLFSAVVRRGVTPAGAMLLVALFASTPLAFIETTALFIENGLALFIFCAFTVLFAAECAPERRVMACVILFSAAIASKLHGFAVAGPLGLVALWVLFTQVEPRRRLPVLVLGLIVVALGGEAYIYAFMATGNPVFPFFNKVFHSPYYPPVNFTDSRWLQPPPYDLFYRETFHTERFGEFSNGAFGFQTVTLLAASGMAALIVSWRALLAIGLGLLYIFAISAGSTYARYLYPGMPLLALGMACLLSGEARGGAAKSLSAGIRMLFAAVMTVLVFVNLALFSTAGWPLSQNFWPGLFNAQKWLEAGDLSLPQLEMNRRVSNDGLPAPRELLFADAVSAGLAGTPLPVNWYDDTLVARFRDARTVDDIARIIRDYRATHASFDVKGGNAAYDQNLVSRALAELGDPIARKGGLILYRLHPDVWLGPDLLAQTPLTPQQNAWQTAGDVDWVKPQGVVLGAGASLQQSPKVLLKRGYLYRLSVQMVCAKPEQNLHIALVYTKQSHNDTGRYDDFPPCGVAGTITRDFDFIAPSYDIAPTIIIDNAQATLLRATLREGYAVR